MRELLEVLGARKRAGLDVDALNEVAQQAERDPVGVGRRLAALSSSEVDLDDAAAGALGARRGKLLAKAGTDPKAVADELRREREASHRGVALPPDFSFPGYSPGLLPIDVRSVQFQEHEDWLGYAVLGGLPYHLNLMRLRRTVGPHNADAHSFPLRREPSPGEPVTVALFGDFGNGLYMPRYIARHMRRQRPDLAVHLGDVYYGGTDQEFEDYLFEPLAPMHSSTELYVLAGNHDLYSGDENFRAYLQKKMASAPGVQRQTSESFRIVGERYQIIGLDTQFGRDGRVTPEQVQLARRWLKEGRPGRTNILLTSAHGWSVTAKKKKDPKAHLSKLAAKDLAPLWADDLVDLWFWGNVHHGALYAPSATAPYVASCVGHSGFPYYRVDTPVDAPFQTRWVETEGRFGPLDLRRDVGNNGWCLLRLHHDGTVGLEYRDWMDRVRHVDAVRRTPTGMKFVPVPG